MLIFLDSNIFCSDFYQISTNFELLKSYISKGGSWLCLSEIVIDEVKNKYREKITAQVQKINNGIRDLNKYVDKYASIISDEYIQDEFKKYSDFWDMLLFEYGDSCPERYPSISHQEVVQRALQRKKPFNEDSKDGYRDFLIWRTFLEAVGRYSMEQACFISLNTRDFSDVINKNELHPDLQEDIRSFKIKLSRIRYFTSLREFIEQQVKPELQAIEEREKLIKGLMGDQQGFVTPIKNSLTETLQGMDVSEYFIYDISEGENPTINEIEEVSEIEIVSISVVSEKEYLLEVKVQILCNIQFFIHKSDFLVMDDISQMRIVDNDWNKHYVLAETPMELEITFEAIYSKDSEQVKSMDIENIENPYDDCIYCPY